MTSTARARSAGLLGLALAALVPKCPLCVVGALSALGLGTAAGWLAPAVRPAAFALALLGVLAVLRSEWRRRALRGGCCASRGAVDRS